MTGARGMLADPFPVTTGIPTGLPGRAQIVPAAAPPPPAYLAWTSLPLDGAGVPVAAASPSATPDPTLPANPRKACCGG